MNEREALSWLRWPFWNDAERRLRALFRIAGFFLVGGIVVFLLSKAGAPRGGLDASMGALVFALRAVVTSTIAAVVAVRFLGRHPVRRLGIVPVPGWWGDLAFGLALGAGLMTLIFGLEYAAGWVRVLGVAYVRSPGMPFAMVMAGMAFVSLCIGYYEELVSRGYLLREIAEGMAGRRVPPAFALAAGTLISSALFARGHADNPNASMVSTVNIFFAGILLAVPFVLTGRLAASIGLHITWNFFQSAVFGFPTSGFPTPASALSIEQGGPEAWTGAAFGPEAGILGLVAMVVGVAAIVGREKLRTGRVEPCAELVAPPPPRAVTLPPAAPSADPEAPAS
jgi:CAAX protease family protein